RMPATPEARLRLAAATSMASTLAQELNQPLTAAVNSLSACTRRLRGLGEEYADVLAMLDHASQETLKAGDIVRRTRNFVVSGRVSLNRENLRTMVERAILMLGEGRDTVGLTTAVPLDRREPSGGGCPLRIDPAGGRLRFGLKETPAWVQSRRGFRSLTCPNARRTIRSTRSSPPAGPRAPSIAR